MKQYTVLNKGRLYVTRASADALPLIESGEYQEVAQEVCSVVNSADPANPSRSLHIMIPFGCYPSVVLADYWRNATEEEIAKFQSEGNPELPPDARLVAPGEPIPEEPTEQPAQKGVKPSSGSLTGGL